MIYMSWNRFCMKIVVIKELKSSKLLKTLNWFSNIQTKLNNFPFEDDAEFRLESTFTAKRQSG